MLSSAKLIFGDHVKIVYMHRKPGGEVIKKNILKLGTAGLA